MSKFTASTASRLLVLTITTIALLFTFGGSALAANGDAVIIGDHVKWAEACHAGVYFLIALVLYCVTKHWIETEVGHFLEALAYLVLSFIIVVNLM